MLHYQVSGGSLLNRDRLINQSVDEYFTDLKTFIRAGEIRERAMNNQQTNFAE